MQPDLSLEIEVVPAFYDVDPMEIVWHGHYAKYLELVRNALMSRFDYSYARMRESGYAWPIVDMRLKYVRSARLGEPVKVRAEIIEYENRLRIAYLLTEASSGRVLNKASTTQVAVDLRTGEMQYVCPPVLWERLGVQP